MQPLTAPRRPAAWAISKVRASVGMVGRKPRCTKIIRRLQTNGHHKLIEKQCERIKRKLTTNRWCRQRQLPRDSVRATQEKRVQKDRLGLLTFNDHHLETKSYVIPPTNTICDLVSVQVHVLQVAFVSAGAAWILTWDKAVGTPTRSPSAVNL